MGKYYWTCPYCNANLDPGECCDCDESRIAMGRTNNYKSVQHQGGDKHNDKILAINKEYTKWID